MGLLDQITGALGQQAGGSGQANQLMQMAVSLINSHPGGLQGLVQQFTQAGLGQQAQSWVSTGQNLPVSAEQITQVLGSGKLQEIAAQLGIGHADAASGLANALPHVVDHLTPSGAVQNDLVQQGLSLLKGKLVG
ncbi:MAG TPA: YidB family protein [Burkholderiales bacterium]|nr:YidB family protein [Burkholderiales bacterium]